MNTPTRWATALALAAAAVPAWSASTIDPYPSSFYAALSPGYFLNNFDGLLDDPNVNERSFSGGGFSYTVSTSTTSGVFVHDDLISTGEANHTLTVTFTAGNPTAVGGDFFIADGFGNFQIAGVTVRIDDGTEVSYVPLTRSGSFQGFLSSAPIVSLTMLADPDPLSMINANSLDNLVVGYVAAVPEPGTWALMLAGMAAVGAVARRSVRHSAKPVPIAPPSV